MIPTQQQLMDEMREFLAAVRVPAGGKDVRIHPWAQKAIINFLLDKVSHIIDTAHRYEQLTQKVRDTPSVREILQEERLRDSE